MTLTADRNTRRADRGMIKSVPMSASKVFAGGLVCRNAAGYAVKGSAALNLRAIGRSNEQVDNSAGSAGDLNVRVEEGIFIWKNSTSTDEITFADIGSRCFIVDDETVAKTSGTGTRSPAGRIVDVLADGGVAVLMGEDILAPRKIYVPIRVATLVGTNVYYGVAPVAGRVTKIYSITEGVLTTGDATLTGKINGAAITTGVLTITQAGSAAGDVDQAVPTAANVVAAGDKLSMTVGGTNATATVANVLVEIEID